MNGEKEQPIPREDSTPSILDQARSAGWEAGYYDFGKGEADGVDYFNPSVIQRPDGIWMLVRRSEPHPQGFRFGQNAIWAAELDETGKMPKRLVRLKWPVEDSQQHFEDPRGFYHLGINQTLVGACTFIWNADGTWTGAHQIFGAFDQDWQCKKIDYPKIGGNPGQMGKIADPKKFEKNWLFWLHENQLHLLYKAKPWLVVGFGSSWTEKTEYRFEKGVEWAYGDLRGGTAPVKVGDYYFTFPHSSLPWKGRHRRYYAGCIAFDAAPPFQPRLVTPEPILRGSQNDPWEQKKPVVIFPCGAIYRNGKWLISAGVNDLKSAWIEIDHESLLARMQPIDEVAPPIFSRNGLSPQETRRERLRANLVKARAAKAANRAEGKKPIKRKKHKMRRRKKILHPN